MPTFRVAARDGNHYTRGSFHKPIYAPRQALTLCAELLRLKKASQKLGAERKALAQSVNGLMKSTPDHMPQHNNPLIFLDGSLQGALVI